MSALAEALLAAQRQALGTLGKVYVAGVFDTEDDAGPRELVNTFEKIGCTDVIDRQQYLACLDVLRDYGAPAPATPRASDTPKMISPGQKPYIRDLFRKKNIEPLDDADLNALPYAKASALIEALKNGTYDPAEYTIPF